MGGEEFLVILQEQMKRNAVITAENLGKQSKIINFIIISKLQLVLVYVKPNK